MAQADSMIDPEHEPDDTGLKYLISLCTCLGEGFNAADYGDPYTRRQAWIAYRRRHDPPHARVEAPPSVWRHS